MVWFDVISLGAEWWVPQIIKTNKQPTTMGDHLRPGGKNHAEK